VIDMAILSDNIEQFIKSMISEYEGMIEIQRNELADYFKCAPSQINYVLATRFSPQRGYIIESRRGGGGYIKVIRIQQNDKQDVLMQLLNDHLDRDKLSQREANEIVEGLKENNLIDEKQARLISAALSNRALNIPALVKDNVRAGILREMIIALLEEDE